ncbi:MAG: hypothetical protein NVSMB23_25440 [Myxococcales bacterium]
MSGLVSWPIAAAAARGRARSPSIIVLAAVATLAALGPVGGGPSDGSGGFAHFWLLILTFVLGAGLISEEVESGHAQLALLRPITRAAWFGGRLAGALLVLGGALAAVGLARTAGALLWRQAPGGPSLPADLIALLLSSVELGGWLSALACLSVVSRGWSNVVRAIFAILGWGTLRLLLPLATRQDPRVSAALGAVEPYLHPRSAGSLARALAVRGAIDPEPLLWNLLFLAAFWTAGVLLMNRLELARRRT